MFVNVIERINEFFRYRETVRELSRLSDRELADVGIVRGDIRSAVRASLGRL